MTEYREQYCEKHNHYYGAHLSRCPICVGEELYIEIQKTVKHIDLTKEKEE